MMWNADGMISRSILGGLVGEALMCFVLCLMPEQVGGEFLAGVIINVSFQMIQENRDGILIRILRLGSFSFNTHAGARRCASRHEAASTNVKIAHGPRCLFHTLPEQKWWKRLQRCVALAEESWKKPALQRGTKCYMHGYREKEKKGVGRESAASRAVSGMLKEDKVAAQRRSPSPPAPIAGFISWAQQERRLGFVPQKPVSLTGFTACCYMPLPTCATVCESFLSHTLSVCVSSHTVSLTAVFSLLLFIYIFWFRQQRVKERKAGLSFLRRSSFWVQTEIWQLRFSQFCCLLIHQMSRFAGNTWEIGLICSNFLQIEFDNRSGSFDSAPVFDFWTFELTVP